MAHAHAPFYARNADVFATAEIVHVANDASRFQHLHGIFKGVYRSAGNHHAVYAAAMSEFEHLLGYRAVVVVDDLVGSVCPCCLGTHGPAAHGIDHRGPPQRRGSHCHEAHGSYADDYHLVAKENVGQLDTVESGGHHVREHHCLHRIDALGDKRKVAVGIIHVEAFGKHAVLDVRVFPSGEHAAGVHGVARLGLERVPVGRDGRHDDTVARLEIFDKGTHLHHLAGGFVTQDHIGTVAERTFPHGVHVGCARGNGDRPDDCVHRTAMRLLFFNPAYMVEADHRKGFHHCVVF